MRFYDSRLMQKQKEQPRNIVREAIAIALEGLAGTAEEWLLATGEQKNATYKHVRQFVHDFAKNRGVVLEDADIDDTLKEIVAELRAHVRHELDLIE